MSDLILSMCKHTKFKILTIGDTGVGKTSLLIRYKEQRFDPNTKNTVAIDFTQRTKIVDDKRYDLQIWDTAGQERFQSVATAYYRDAHAAFVVFDITNHMSFANTQTWIDRLIQDFHQRGNKQKPVLILVGNKADLTPHAVKRKEINQLAEKYGISNYIETSAKTGEKVDELFDSLIDLLINRGDGDNIGGMVKLKTTSSAISKGGGCCN